MLKNIDKISKSIFKQWLSENIHRFNNKPIHNKKGEFYFEGITKAISLIMDFDRLEAMLNYTDIDTGENYDFGYMQYIGELEFDPIKGFYDADRTDKVYIYYNTFKELIITEVFEEILKYCNKNFKKDNSVYLINYGGSTEGFIASTDETNILKLVKLKLRNNKDTYYININYLLRYDYLHQKLY